MRPPHESGTFHLVVVAAMRVKQLARGCVPRVAGNRPRTVIARIEVEEGRVVATNTIDAPGQGADAHPDRPASVARAGAV